VKFFHWPLSSKIPTLADFDGSMTVRCPSAILLIPHELRIRGVENVKARLNLQRKYPNFLTWRHGWEYQEYPARISNTSPVSAR
jgi:hypothetical protein